LTGAQKTATQGMRGSTEFPWTWPSGYRLRGRPIPCLGILGFRGAMVIVFPVWKIGYFENNFHSFGNKTARIEHTVNSFFGQQLFDAFPVFDVPHAKDPVFSPASQQAAVGRRPFLLLSRRARAHSLPRTKQQPPTFGKSAFETRSISS
jgi:hypothetical protein